LVDDPFSEPAIPFALFKQGCLETLLRVDAGCLNIAISKVDPMIFRASVLTLLMTTAVSAISHAAAQEKSDAPKLETTIDKASYAIGYNIGKDILKQGLDPAALAAGIAAALAGEKSALSPEETQAAFKAMQAEMH